MDRGAWRGMYSPWGHKESDMTEWWTLLMGRYQSLGILKSFFHIHPSCLGKYPVFVTSWVPQCSPWGVAAASWLPCCRYSPFQFLLGLRNSHWEGWNHWWLWHPCLLIPQGIFHFSPSLSPTLFPGHNWAILEDEMASCDTSFSVSNCF